MLFYVNPQGQVIVDQVHVIDPNQAWFWTERWQRMEREVDEDIAAGRVHTFENVEDFIKSLHEEAEKEDAKNKV